MNVGKKQNFILKGNGFFLGKWAEKEDKSEI